MSALDCWDRGSVSVLCCRWTSHSFVRDKFSEKGAFEINAVHGGIALLGIKALCFFCFNAFQDGPRLHVPGLAKSSLRKVGTATKNGLCNICGPLGISTPCPIALSVVTRLWSLILFVPRPKGPMRVDWASGQTWLEQHTVTRMGTPPWFRPIGGPISPLSASAEAGSEEV